MSDRMGLLQLPATTPAGDPRTKALGDPLELLALLQRAGLLQPGEPAPARALAALAALAAATHSDAVKRAAKKVLTAAGAE